jgi:hypothetical protein
MPATGSVTAASWRGADLIAASNLMISASAAKSIVMTWRALKEHRSMPVIRQRGQATPLV